MSAKEALVGYSDPDDLATHQVIKKRDAQEV
jgi:hypothetical protein